MASVIIIAATPSPHVTIIIITHSLSGTVLKVNSDLGKTDLSEQLRLDGAKDGKNTDNLAPRWKVGNSEFSGNCYKGVGSKVSGKLLTLKE